MQKLQNLYYGYFQAVTMMSGDTNMSMVTKEIKGVEFKASAIVEKITQRMKELGVMYILNYSFRISSLRKN